MKKVFEFLKKNFKYVPWVMAMVLGFMLFNAWNKEPEKEYIPVKVVVEVPVIEKQFDTIYKPAAIPKPKVEIDSAYYEKYQQLKDSVARDSAYQEAIRINDYKTVYDDSIQTITVYSKTRGDLLAQTAYYKTKPRVIEAEETIEVPRKIKFHVGVEGGVPTIPTLSTSPVAKVNLMLVTKRENTWSVSYDTEGRVWVGKTWKIKL